MANSRAILAVACTVVLSSWLSALGGVVAGTVYVCQDAIAMSPGMQAPSMLAGDGGGGFSTFDASAGSDGADAADDRAPAMRGLSLSNCGRGFRMHFWTLAFHFFVWALALRAVQPASRASYWPRAAPLSPLFAVAVAFATWSATLDFEQIEGGTRSGAAQGLELAFNLLLTTVNEAMGGWGAAHSATASAAGFTVLAACALGFMVACAVAGVAVVPAAARASPPPPMPSASVAAAGKKKSVAAAAATDEEAAVGVLRP